MSDEEMARENELAREQDYISMLYERLDEARERTSARLASVLLQTGGTPQARLEREDSSVMYMRQLAQFDAAEHGLCFGRLDLEDEERRYIGRIGLRDASDDYEQVLMDWRAPAARPFYLATPVSPEGVRRRRHIKIMQRKVTGLDDEVLDLSQADPDGKVTLTGEAALLAALDASRTGRMSDIVETIQAEQDTIIRSGHKGVLVVQGGPGTGKTAVALHRAAYLLYTYRELLSKSGVLIVGPNPTFLRYIEQVLPSLGETGVLLSTIGELYPGVSTGRANPAEVAELKGRELMKDVITAAVRDRQWVPRDGLDVPFDRDTLQLDRQTIARARTRARRSRRPHNHARRVFAREIIDALAAQVADRIGRDVLADAVDEAELKRLSEELGEPVELPRRGGLLSAEEISEIREELLESPGVRAAIQRLWPVLTPQQLLTDLFASKKRLASAARQLKPAERDLLRRPQSDAWSPADVPLLDEAAELLGEDDTSARAAAERARRQRIAYAQGVLDIMSRDIEDDPEILMAHDMLDAEQLAERQEDEVGLTAAERAAGDRTWAFGHVIVDEAQELSEMAWRMLMRRCPSKSMTIVGDVAQTGDAAGTSSWDRMLRPHVGDRWRQERLTVNYRTPSEIMKVAADVLAVLGADEEPPHSVRDAGVDPWSLRVPSEELADRLAGLAGAEARKEGNLAIIVPAALHQAMLGALPEANGTDLESEVVVLTVRQAKGLEFDTVLIAEPDRILAESPRGMNDLYVALTRSTRRLGVVHTGPLPEVLSGLAPA